MRKYPLTSAQSAIWFDQQFHPESAKYNIGGCFVLNGEISVPALKEAFQTVINSAEALLASFSTEDGVPYQIFQPAYELDIPFTDYSGNEDGESLVRQWMEDQNRVPISFSEPFLFQLHIFKLRDDQYSWFFKFHHILVDGFGISLVVRNVAAAYSNIVTGKKPAEKTPAYTSFIEEEESYKNMPSYQLASNYWKEKLRDLPEPLDIKRTNEPTAERQSKRLDFTISRAVYEEAGMFCKAANVSMFHYFLGLLHVHHYHFWNQPEWIIGLPIANRVNSASKNTIGLFTSVMPLRLKGTDLSFRELLLAIKQDLRESYRYQKYPINEMYKDIQFHGEKRRTLYDVTISFQKHDYDHTYNGVTTKSHSLENSADGPFLAVQVGEWYETGDITISLDYATDFWSGQDILLFKERFVHLFSDLMQRADSPVKNIAVLSPKEQDMLTQHSDRLHIDYPRDETIGSLFEKQVEINGRKVALEYNGQSLTYDQLELRANAIARLLIEKGVRSGDFIGVLLPKGPDMIVSLLGILKAGACYVPIDPGYPAGRIQYMLSDSGCAIVLTDHADFHFAGLSIDVNTIDFTSGEPIYAAREIHPDQPAYVIYTSGSTGKPKGVVIQHENVVRLFFSDQRLFDFNASDVWTMFHSYCFDFSVWEMYGALLFGGKLIIVDPETARDTTAFLDLLIERQVTVLNQTPGAFKNVSDEEERRIASGLKHLRCVIFGGEALYPVQLSAFRSKYPETKLINMYGITETTVHVSYKEITAREIAGNVSNIGSAIPTLAMYIMDENGNARPIGATGEICIAGKGLAKGYLNREEITREKFVDHPFLPGQKLYRSGDLGRYLENGEIEYRGRMDHQVKIRGFRIELGEIEAALQKNALLSQAVVADREINGEKYLVAYYIEKKPIDTAELKRYLSATLPEYMVPAFWVQMDSLPLTSNGKIDKKNLPDPVVQTDDYQAPETVLEKAIAGIWKELFGLEKIGREDNFFDLGGHSLKASQFIARFHKLHEVQLSLKDVFHSPFIRELGKLAEQAKKKAFRTIPKAAEQDGYRISSAQRRMFALQEMNPDSLAYNMPACITINGDLAFDRAKAAFLTLIRRHATLRTAFEVREGEPIMVVLKEVTAPVTFSDTNASQTIENFVRPFKLREAPLFRVAFSRITATSHLMLFDMHHIISDGISFQRILKEFVQLYSGEAPDEWPLQFNDYSESQQTQVQSGAYAHQKEYWLRELKGAENVLELPCDFARPSLREFAGNTVPFQLSTRQLSGIKKLAKRNDATLFVTLLSLYNLLLHKYSGQEEFFIGTPVSGRNHPDLDGIIGLFVNTLPIKSSISETPTFTAFTDRIKQTCLNAFDHADYPLDELADMVVDKRDHSRNPLFDTVFIFQNADDFAVQSDQLDFNITALETKTAKFDLTLTLTEQDDQLNGVLEYNTSLFREATIQRLANCFNVLTDALLNNPDAELAELSLLSLPEQAVLTERFDKTAIGYPEKATIVSLFEQQAQASPQRVALVFKERTLTYAELDQKANAIAELLVSKGVQPGEIVGVLLPKGLEMIISLLGILKAGGCYLPIDPDYPAERIEYMRSDSGCRLLLSDSNELDLEGFIDLNTVDYTVAYSGKTTIHPQDPAYVIYTSGSTGQPKGVVISHCNVVRLFFSEQSLFDFNDSDVWTMFHSYCFDFSVWEMYGALLFGAKLVIVDKDTARDTGAFVRLLEEEQVTVLNQTPGAFKNVSEEVENSAPELALRYVIFGGEALHPVQLRSFSSRYPKTSLINMYGITETTVHVTYKEITDKEIQNNVSNIGTTIPTLALYIMDRHLSILPEGVPGEICIAGEGLALGYLNREEITREKFVDHPFLAGQKLYRSGDMGRYLDNGEIEYLGRMDQQVKIRGFRIEPGEVAAALQKHSSLSQVVVKDREINNEQHLVAYYTGQAVESAALKDFLSAQLPDYMLPSFWVPLEQMPLTANGKIDVKSLPDPELQGTNYQEPETETEICVANAFSTILGLEKAGKTANYFELGGDSIKAIRVINEINKTGNFQATVPDLYRNPVVENLAAALASTNDQHAESRKKEHLAKKLEQFKADFFSEHPTMAGNVEDVYPLSDIELGMIYYSLRHPGESIYHDQQVWSINDPAFDHTVFQQALDLMIQKHELLRTSIEIVRFGEPLQLVHRQVDVLSGFEDLSSHTAEAANQYLVNRLKEDRNVPFDIRFNHPLWRIAVFRLDETKLEIVLSCHHAIIDGWSYASLMTELCNTYIHLLADSQFVPAKLKSSYKDYVIRQLLVKESAEYRSFWKQELDGFNRLNLPSPTGTGQLSLEANMADRSLHRSVLNYARSKGVSPKTIFFSAYAFLMKLMSYESDVVVGLVEHGRPSLEDADKIIGCFLNTIPFRINFSTVDNWSDLVAFTDKKLKELKMYGELPLSEIARESGVSQEENPLFDTHFTYVDFHIAGDSDDHFVAGNQYSDHNYVKTNTHFDFIVSASYDNLGVGIQFLDSLFSRQQVKGFLEVYTDILRSMVENEAATIDSKQLLDKHKALQSRSAGKGIERPAHSVYELFEKNMHNHPEKIAVSEKGSHYSYRELDNRITAVSAQLGQYGLKSQDKVLILLPHSIDAVATLMACLRLNVAYIPVDTNYPADRINYIMEDAGTDAIITHPEIVSKLGLQANRIIIPTGNPSADQDIEIRSPEPTDLAYVIYTSGSTGKPKGALIHHSGLTNYCSWAASVYANNGPADFPLYSSLAFDLTVTSIFVPLISGNRIVIYGNEDNVLQRIIEDRETSCIKVTPAHLQLMRELDLSHSTITTIIVGGEELKSELARELSNAFNHPVVLFNEYGPTETVVGCTIHAFNSENDTLNSVSIGLPIDNTGITIVDDRNQEMLLGATGEILISGAGVAEGYLNKRELTAEKFIPYFHKRAYKSGDLGYIAADATLHFVSRIDHQLKIRGYRIEPGEIEAVISAFPGVHQAVIIDRENTHGKYLVAYYTAAMEIDPAAFKEHLLKQLPEYMVPEFYIHLSSIPLTSNGKTDRKRFPEPDFNPTEKQEEPATPTEESVLRIWKELLPADTMGTTDNFFQLGGNSLTATLLIAKLYKAFRKTIPLSEVFKHPTIKAIARFIDEETASSAMPFTKAETKLRYEASQSQKRLFILQQLADLRTVYNTPFAVNIYGEFHPDKAQKAFAQLIERHESLRTSFFLENGSCYQHIHPTVDFQLTFNSVTEQEAIGAGNDFMQPFELDTPPLLRVAIFQTKADQYQLLIDMHHIISDGISAQVLIREFSELYAGKTLLTPAFQYKDFSEWQLQLFDSPVLEQQKSFWTEKMQNAPVLELPCDFHRPAVQSFQGSTIDFVIPREQLTPLNQIGSETGSTLFMVLLAAFKTLLSKYSGQNDLVIGTPVSGRTVAELEHTIGLFVNTLPIRTQPQEHKSFGTFLQEVKTETLAAFEHQDYPFDELVEALQLKRDLSRNPLYDLAFVLQNTGNEVLKAENVEFTPVKIENETSKFDLTLTVTEQSNELRCHFEFSTALFKASTIQRLIRHFKTLVDQLQLNATLGELSLLTEANKSELIRAFDKTAIGYPEKATIVSLFEQQAQASPQRVALVFKERTLTYAELDQKANAIAEVLVSKGVQPGEIVGVLLPKGLEMIISLLGILKAGACYLPIDPDYPAERIEFMRSDSGCRLLLSDSNDLDLEGFIDLNTVDYTVAYSGKTTIHPQDPAYIIYTSGSTGQPKGVVITHRSVVRLFFSEQPLFDFNESDVWTMFHSYCFDFSVWEMYGALLFGAKLVIVDKDTARDTGAFVRLLEEQQVTVLNQTPGAFKNVSEEVETSAPELALRYVIFGGEALHPVQLRSFRSRYPKTSLINMYGITETTVHVTYKEITDKEIQNNVSNIGTTIPTLALYIMDRHLNILPEGVPGEICIAGEGLALGYLNREEITREKFVDHPFLAGQKLYRSGDMGRYLDNGEIEYLGRMDQQVKIRGFRIEPGEVAAALQKHPSLSQVVVKDREINNEKHLVAYYTGQAVETTALKDFLSAQLPDYMLPSFWVPLEQMPLTANGKIDVKSLPDPELQGTNYQEPETETEICVARIWKDILGMERIGKTDNFFELGGHSLKATRLVAAIGHQLNKTISLKAVFTHPTLEDMARVIAASQSVHLPPIVPLDEAASYALSNTQNGIWVYEQLHGPSTTYNIPICIKLEASLDPSLVEAALHIIVARHESLRTSFGRVNDDPRMFVHQQITLPFTAHDLWGAHSTHSVTELIHQAENTIFHLDQAPLFSVRLLQLDEHTCMLHINMHHIISDGWSVLLFFREFFMVYQSLQSDTPYALPVINIQYKDFAGWHREILQGETGKTLKAFWQKRLAGELVNISVHPDFERPSRRTQNGSMIQFELSADLSTEIDDYLKGKRLTPFAFFQTAFKVLLFRITNTPDIIIGTPVSGRPLAALQNQVGLFVNTLPLRTILEENQSFEDLLVQVSQETIEAFDHQLYPFDKIVEDLQLASNAQRAPLFNIGLTWQAFEDDGTMNYTVMEDRHETSKYELWLFGQEHENRYRLHFEFNTDLYREETIAGLFNKLEMIIEQVIRQPELNLSEIKLIGENVTTKDISFDFNF